VTTTLHQVRDVASPTISTTELHDRLADPGLTIVDVRPLAAYNGWRLDDELRGGHIPGAVAFPNAWLDIVDEADVQRLLDAKGATADRSLVVYGYGFDDALPLADRLARLGVASILGGAIGNLTDRVRLGYVIDFVDGGIGDLRWYTFNVADAAISCALLLLILVSLRPSLARVGVQGNTESDREPSA